MTINQKDEDDRLVDEELNKVSGRAKDDEMYEGGEDEDDPRDKSYNLGDKRNNEFLRDQMNEFEKEDDDEESTDGEIEFEDDDEKN